MFMTSVNGRGLFEDLFDDILGEITPSAKPEKNFSLRNVMQTDIMETPEGYQLLMNLPGYSKENIEAVVDNGYLTVTAKCNQGKDNSESTEEATDSNTSEATKQASKPKVGYICRERYVENCKRSFYVGNNVSRDDIKASFENGVLEINIPKKDKLPKEDRTIAIN
ncbi:MAG: Hsp20 family protein [Lachnospiraceae bacterium]|nr:Hsp20 family protein [Lachnospiraceae bacterium]